jgi:hypothetical protein
MEKKNSDFVSRIEKIIMGAGGFLNTTELSISYPLALKTKYGELFLLVEGPDDNFSIGSIYCMFDKPELVNANVECNPLSGKWNFHYNEYTKMTEDEAVAYFQNELNKVM